MKQWKKYLAAAGTVFVILALFLIINNNNSRKESAKEAGSTEVNESVQTVESDINRKEAAILSADEAKTAEQGTVEADSAELYSAAVETQSVSEEDIEAEIKKLINTYYEISDKSDKDNESTKEQTSEAQTVESQTVESQTAKTVKTESDKKKNEIIEKYKNIKTYIKPGLDNESYVVFATYEIKLYNIDTLVPGMSSLSVTRDDLGELQIVDNTDDKELKDYILKLSKEKDIKKVIKNVNTKLTDAMSKDNSLNQFIDYLK